MNIGPLAAVGARGTVVLGLAAAAEALAVSVVEEAAETDGADRAEERESGTSDEEAAGAV